MPTRIFFAIREPLQQWKVLPKLLMIAQSNGPYYHPSDAEERRKSSRNLQQLNLFDLLKSASIRRHPCSRGVGSNVVSTADPDSMRAIFSSVDAMLMSVASLHHLRRTFHATE